MEELLKNMRVYSLRGKVVKDTHKPRRNWLNLRKKHVVFIHLRYDQVDMLNRILHDSGDHSLKVTDVVGFEVSKEEHKIYEAGIEVGLSLNHVPSVRGLFGSKGMLEVVGHKIVHPGVELSAELMTS